MRVDVGDLGPCDADGAAAVRGGVACVGLPGEAIGVGLLQDRFVDPLDCLVASAWRCWPVGVAHADGGLDVGVGPDAGAGGGGEREDGDCGQEC